MIFSNGAGARHPPSGQDVGRRDGASGDLGEGGHPEFCAGRLGRDLVELGEFLAGAVEADLQPVDLAEPAFAAGVRDAGVEVVADLDESRALDGVGLRQRTC